MAVREGSLMAAMAGGGWLRAALLCAGVWLHAADSLLVATMMPTAIAEIGGKTRNEAKETRAAKAAGAMRPWHVRRDRS